ncbi:MAG: helix-turn-helix domain-containing protein [Aminipila sp.]
MEQTKIGNIIRYLRQEKGMTQKQVADRMNISDKTISKWERGLGCPDISLLAELCDLLDVNMQKMLNGDLEQNEIVGGNMKKSKYFICPICNNISICTGNAEISCCGRKLDEQIPKKADEQQKMIIEQVENDWYITSNHEMSKKCYISFVAFATGDRIQVIKQYPEWDLQIRIPNRGHGMLIWHSTKSGLLYQLV